MWLLYFAYLWINKLSEIAYNNFISHLVNYTAHAFNHQFIKIAITNPESLTLQYHFFIHAWDANGAQNIHIVTVANANPTLSILTHNLTMTSSSTSEVNGIWVSVRQFQSQYYHETGLWEEETGISKEELLFHEMRGGGDGENTHLTQLGSEHLPRLMRSYCSISLAVFLVDNLSRWNNPRGSQKLTRAQIWPQTTHRSNPAGGMHSCFSDLDLVVESLSVEFDVLVVFDLCCVDEEEDTDPEGVVRVDFVFWDGMVKIDNLSVFGVQVWWSIVRLWWKVSWCWTRLGLYIREFALEIA